jgi:hypothetical protein
LTHDGGKGKGLSHKNLQILGFGTRQMFRKARTYVKLN